jgi:DNA modification methylase
MILLIFKIVLLQNSIPEQNRKEDYYVWDPFMGTGTTGVACAEMKCCIFFGGDSDADLYDDASSRVATAFLRMLLIYFTFSF